MTITDAMAKMRGLAYRDGRSAHLVGIDFAGKRRAAREISNDLKKALGAEGKRDFKDNGGRFGHSEIVVACLFEGGEHGALAARVAAKVIQAYVVTARRR